DEQQLAEQEQEKTKKQKNKLSELFKGSIRTGFRTGFFLGKGSDNIGGGEFYITIVDKSGLGLNINLGGYKRNLSSTKSYSYLFPVFISYHKNISSVFSSYVGAGPYIYNWIETGSMGSRYKKNSLKPAFNLGLNVFSSKNIFFNIDTKMYLTKERGGSRSAYIPVNIGCGFNINW
ncbi:MAG: hypothetical protein ACOC56_04230, partial [Atribacterota bacterium]